MTGMYPNSLVILSILIAIIGSCTSLLLAKRAKRLHRQLAKQAAYQETLLEAVLDCILIFNHEGTILECNSAVEMTFGYHRQEVVGRKIIDLIHAAFLHDQSQQPRMVFSSQEISLLDKRIETTGVYWDGAEFPIEVGISQIEDEGQPLFLCYIRDITERKRTEELFNQIAYHDPLTGMPNRNLFNERFNVEMARAKLHQQRISILFIDLDGFKSINDTLGHSIGDRLLKTVAKRLTGCLREADTVSRMGGDEFIILLPALTRDETVQIAERIIDEITAPFEVDEHEFYITCSIGISCYPEDAQNGEDLVQLADAAMYRVKDRGKNSYEFYA